MNATRVSAPFALSRFRNCRDNRPEPHTLSLDALQSLLTTFRLAPHTRDKSDLPAWSPARFAPGATRSSSAVVDLCCLVLDLDTPPFDPAPWQGWRYLRHTTWSHTPAHPKGRLVLPLARPVPASRWGAAWAWAQARAPSLDRKCCDPGRLYFLPAIPAPDHPHEAEIHEGDLLDLADLCPAPPPPPPPPPRLPVPWFLRQRVASRRLLHDPLTREAFAAGLQARIRGEGRARRAERIPCPACGRPSVWFPIAPERQRRAYCNHRASCGWSGALADLDPAQARP